MSNQNNLPNHHVNNEHDENESSDEGEQHHTINVIIYIIIVVFPNVERPTALGVQAVDERINIPQDLTNEQIDEAIQLPLDRLDTTMPALCWLILMFYASILYGYWPLFIMELITYQLFTSNTQSRINSFGPSSFNEYFIPPHFFDANRDAQAESRTAQATEETIRFSNTVEIVESVPYGIQATIQTPDTNILADLNNAQHTDIITNHENDNTNGGEIVPPNVQNEPNVRITTNEDNLPQPVVDDPTYNINPLGSIESHDDVHSSDSSDDEDRIISSESGFDGDGEDDSSSDENDQTHLLNRMSPVVESPPNTVQNNCPLNQINPVDEQAAAIIPSRHEASDAEAIVNNPAEVPEQLIISPSHSTTANLIPKPVNTVVRNNEPSDEQST